MNESIWVWNSQEKFYLKRRGSFKGWAERSSHVSGWHDATMGAELPWKQEVQLLTRPCDTPQRVSGAQHCVVASSNEYDLYCLSEPIRNIKTWGDEHISKTFITPLLLWIQLISIIMWGAEPRVSSSLVTGKLFSDVHNVPLWDIINGNGIGI